MPGKSAFHWLKYETRWHRGARDEVPNGWWREQLSSGLAALQKHCAGAHPLWLGAVVAEVGSVKVAAAAEAAASWTVPFILR